MYDNDKSVSKKGQIFQGGTTNYTITYTVDHYRLCYVNGKLNDHDLFGSELLIRNVTQVLD